MSVEENTVTMRQIFKEVREGKRRIDAETLQFLTNLKTDYDVVIKLLSIGGVCPAKHKVGDEWVMKGGDDLWRTPNMCMFAFSALYPNIQMLMYGGSYPWEPDSEAVLVPCPDSRNSVVFEVKRIGKV